MTPESIALTHSIRARVRFKTNPLPNQPALESEERW
jgi:hypothetical protein